MRNSWIIAGAVAGVPAAAALLYSLLAPAINENNRRPRSNDAASTPPLTSGSSDQSEPVLEDFPNLAPAAEQAVDDPSGELLWASPTAGAPISLAYVPAGTQCLVHLRPHLLATHPEGEKVLAALGPWGRAAVARLHTLAAAELMELDAVLIAIVPTKDGGLDAALRIEPSTPWDAAELSRRLPESREAEHGGQKYRVAGDRAYFLPPTSPGAKATTAALVVCPAKLAPELIDSAGEPPPLVRDVESLVQHSDAARAATVIVSPKFLLASGNDLLIEQAEPLDDAIEWLLKNDATALAVALHWDENFFVEVRAVPALNVPPRRLAAKLRERIGQAPDLVEEQVLASPWHPHGRKVLARFPGMLRKLAGYSRTAEDHRQALVRCYLPPIAGHNLLMAAELMLTQPHGETPVAPVVAAPAPHTVAERLAAKTSLSFAKETLERALELLAADTGLAITIAGADLQLEGITKNQSLGLDLRDQPAGSVLLEILLRCNPDRTAKGPADARQKLVYIIESAQGDAPERIIVTTRTAVEKRGAKLPNVFVGETP